MKLCSCVLFGCKFTTSQDPLTNETVEGQYLPLTTWRRHQSNIPIENSFISPNMTLPSLEAIDISVPISDAPIKFQKPEEPMEELTFASQQMRSNELSKLRVATVASISTIKKPIKLKFKTRPSLEVPCPDFTHDWLFRCISSQSELETYDFNNDMLSNSLATLVEIHHFLETIQTHDNSILSAEKDSLRIILKKGFMQIHSYMREEWKRQAHAYVLPSGLEDHGTRVVVTNDHVSAYETLKQVNPVTLLSVWLVLVLHYLCHLSQDRANFVLRIMRLIISLIELFQGQTTHLANGVPNDLRTTETTFGLKPILTKYLSCPQCWKLYHPNDIDAGQGSPKICTYKEVSGEPECGSPLWAVEFMQGVPRYVPRLTFVYQDFPNWLARFLSRPGIEKLLHRPLQNLKGNSPSLIHDIWDGNAVRGFKDKEGNPFFVHLGQQLRLLFGFGYDGFNPFHNKAGRKKASVGAIFLVCYNLPSNLRLLPENIFLVGVVPGPKQPSLTQLNHYMEPLVKDLHEFYERGYIFPFTVDSPNRIMVRGVIFPGIMDVHAARQVFGIGSYHRQWFCTHCLLPLDNIDMIEPNHWPRWHTCQKHRGLMEIWKNSPTLAAQEQVFEQTNLRWTVLSQLTYFDMRLMCIFDPMHTFQNLFRNLIENTWDMNTTQTAGDGIFVGSRPVSKKVVTNKEICDILRAVKNCLETGNSGAMKAARRAPLWFLCERHELRRAGERVEPYRQTLIDFYGQSPEIFENDLREFQAKSGSEAAGDRKSIKTIRVRLASMKPQFQVETVDWLKIQSLDDLRQLCQERGIEYGWRDLRSSLAAKLIQNQISYSVNVRSQDLPAGKPVLGKDEINEINKDIVRTCLPSWVQTGPKSFNADGHGELSASEWRTSVLIRLVVTLPRIWCSRGPRYLSILDNFMHLTNAAVIASTRTVITSQHSSNIFTTADLYRREYEKYLQGRVLLYPTRKIQPTEHYAYHLGAQMEDFGPLPIASTNALERCNGMLQDFPTNRRWSDIEETMMNKFCQGANLKALTDCDVFGPILNFHTKFGSAGTLTMDWVTQVNTLLQDAQKSFRKTFSTGGGSMFQDVMDFQNPDYFSPKRSDLENTRKWYMSQELMIPLIEYLNCTNPSRHFVTERESIIGSTSQIITLEPKGWALKECQYYGTWFRKSKPRLMPQVPGERVYAHKDSHIWFQTVFSHEPMAGTITDIFAYEYYLPNTNAGEFDVYLGVRAFVPLTPEEGLCDPYRRYPISGGRLYKYEMAKKGVVISIKDVLCQLAVTPFEKGEILGGGTRCVHVLPLIWHNNFRPYDFSAYVS